MKIKFYILYALSCLLYVTSHAQNIVPNPSFEDTVHCPSNQGQIYYAQNWESATSVSAGGTPDYFNVCNTAPSDAYYIPNNYWGDQYAHTGSAYAGFYAYEKLYHNAGREYIETQLTSTLITNHTYSVSFHVSLADNAQYAIGSIGAYFSNNQIASTSSLVLSYTPQVQNKGGVLTDKNNWMLVTDSFIANGGEQYIIIGNFNIDSMSDTLYLGFSTSVNSAYYYIDDISVIDLGLSSGIEHLKNKHAEINIYPNPSNGKFVLTGFDASQKNASIEVTDVTGKQVFKQQNIILNSSVELNLSLDNGVYFVNLISESNNNVQKLIVQH